MPPRKRATEPTDEFPAQRMCATNEVHERLLRTVTGYAEARSEIENRTARVLGFAEAILRTGCTQIPVVVHVVHRTAAENISDAQIASQITVLNDDFRAANADRTSTPAVFQPLIGDARVTFKLADVDPGGDPTNGITRTQSSNTSFTSQLDDVKSAGTGGADAWPADRYLNLWTCGNLRDSAGRSLLGYAQFPGGPAATDGVVILQSAFGTTGTATAPFNLGRTATHEIGHWLNLRHIWGDDGTGCAGSDFVADTPNAAGPNFGAPAFPHVSCGNGPNGDLFVNYMDYTDDAAMFMFTQGQVDRMQAALDGPRSTVGVTGPCDGKPAKEIVKEFPKEPFKDVVKERPKDFTKETPKEIAKEWPKDPPKDVKEVPKDPPKDNPKEFTKEQPKEIVFDPPKHLLDPPKGPAGDVPIPVPSPMQPGAAGQVGATPFVLGGRGDQPCAPCGAQVAAVDPLMGVVQQLGAVLAGYYAAAAEGRLDAAGSARWQQLAAVYAQLVALLG
jgi:hypothetical protein